MENSSGRLVNLILFFLVVILAAWLVKVNYLDKPTLITVVGEGNVSVKPEMVTFTLSLVNYSSSTTGAIADNTRLTQSVILILKNEGVADKDINAAYVRVIPAAAGSGTNQYQAVNSIDVTLREINKFDSLFTTLYGAGVQSITNIVFTTENSRDLEKQAVTRAMTDAQSRAKEIAQASGKTLGRMVSVTTGEVGQAGALSGSTQAGLGGQIQASPAQIKITRQASIVFELR